MAHAMKKRPAPEDPDAGRSTLELIREIIPDAETWLDALNSHFGRTPRELLGQPEEPVLRNLVLAVKYGFFS